MCIHFTMYLKCACINMLEAEMKLLEIAIKGGACDHAHQGFSWSPQSQIKESRSVQKTFRDFAGLDLSEGSSLKVGSEYDTSPQYACDTGKEIDYLHVFGHCVTRTSRLRMCLRHILKRPLESTLTWL